MKATVFVGASVDGFIARPNGGLDWLPAGGGEAHGYEEFIASVDAIVIGRKTLETVTKVPMLSEASAASALVFGAFELIFYWCAIVALAVVARRLGQR